MAARGMLAPVPRMYRGAWRAALGSISPCLSSGTGSTCVAKHEPEYVMYYLLLGMVGNKAYRLMMSTSAALIGLPRRTWANLMPILMRYPCGSLAGSDTNPTMPIVPE